MVQAEAGPEAGLGAGPGVGSAPAAAGAPCADSTADLSSTRAGVLPHDSSVLLPHASRYAITLAVTSVEPYSLLALAWSWKGEAMEGGGCEREARLRLPRGCVQVNSTCG